MFLQLSFPREEDWDPEEFDSVVSVIPAFKFSIFLAVLESKLVTTILANICFIAKSMTTPVCKISKKFNLNCSGGCGSC